MSERQARAARRRKPANNGSPPEPEEAVLASELAPAPKGQNQEDGEMSFPGVFVYRVPGPNPGEEKIELAPVNGLDPFAVPSLLRFAANYHESRLGIRKAD